MSFYLASRVLNFILGGRFDQTLCARIAEARGTNCLFCRAIGLFTDPDHCAAELARWWTRK